MQYKIIYHDVVNCKYLGEGFKPITVVHTERQFSPSQLWFCTVCGRSYIKVIVRNSKYIAVANNCENCHKDGLLYQTRITLPGSILMEGYNTIEELSDEMLRRELLLELNAVKYLIDKGLI